MVGGLNAPERPDRLIPQVDEARLALGLRGQACGAVADELDLDVGVPGAGRPHYLLEFLVHVIQVLLPGGAILE